MPAWVRTLYLVRLVASCAILASRIWLSEAVKFVTSEFARLIACCKRFSPAPTTPITLPSEVLAAEIAASADWAFPELRISALLDLADEATAAELLTPIAAAVPALSD